MSPPSTAAVTRLGLYWSANAADDKCCENQRFGGRGLRHGGRRGGGCTPELPLPDGVIGPIDAAVAVGVALHVRGGRADAEAGFPIHQVGRVDVAVFIEVGVERA